MKKIISILVCAALIMSFFPTAMAADVQKSIYYVSPDGSNKNSGTSPDAAWKSFSYAAANAKAGDTVIFKDGTYNEENLGVFVNSGTEDAPIVFKSENKHGAIINYAAERTNVNSKVQINKGKEYIEIRDFVFTQETPSENSTSDIMLRVYGGRHCKFIGNKIDKVFEEGIKLSNAIGVLVEGNIITKTGHEGIDSVNSADCVIRNNEIIDCGRTGVMIKGNSRNFLVYNNLVKNTEVAMANGGYAFTVGGATGVIEGTTMVDYETGFEAYNCIFYNNVVYGSDKKIRTGFAYIGAKDCACYNNTIVGVTNGFSFGNNGGIANGWGWDAGNLNPIIKNNIVSDAVRVFDMAEEPENLVSDFNLYHNITNEESIPSEENSVVGNPMFIDSSSDWKIPLGSSAAKAGESLPEKVEAFAGYEEIEGITEGKMLTIERTDFNGASRKTPYDIGAFNRETVKSADLIYEDFETGTIGEDVVGWNGWINKNTSKPNDSYFKIQKESDSENNLVGEITRTNSNSSSVQFIPAKNITEGTGTGKFNVFRFRIRSDHPNTQAAAVSLYGSDGKSCGITIYFNNSRVFFGSKNKYIKNGALDREKWYNFEVRLNLSGSDNKGTLLLGGGQLFSHGCHYVDILLWFLGNPVAGSHFGTKVGTPWMMREGTSALIMKFENGALGYHGATWGARGTRLGFDFQIQMEKAMLEYDGRAKEVRIYEGEQKHVPGDSTYVIQQNYEVVEKYEGGKMTQNEILHFIDCVENGKTPLTDGYGTLQGLRVIWAVYDAEKHNTVADLRGLGLNQGR